MKILDIKTYGDAADLVNRCDEDDIEIFTVIKNILDEELRIPVCNYGLFKVMTSFISDDTCLLRFHEDDGCYVIN